MTDSVTLLDQWSVVADGLDHPEGICVDGDGRVYAGGEAGQIYLVDLDAGTSEEVANTGGFVLGLCADGEGLLYACDLRRRQLLRVDPASGSVEVHSAGTDDRPMHTPNWPVFDHDGNLYVTDSGEWKASDGRVYRITPDGSTTVWTDACNRFPNGACLSAGGDGLLVVESLGPAVTLVPIGDDGVAGAPETVAKLPPSVPDGVVIDVDGTAYVTCYRPDRIYRVGDGGRVEVLADEPEGTVLAAPTNGVFVGSRLVVANLGRWHLASTDLGVEGQPLAYPSLRRR